MKRAFLTALLLAALALPAAGASVSRTYSYFSIGGKSLSDIEQQLRTRGPHVKSTGQRHPGATRLEFITNVTYEDTSRHCRIAGAQVTVKAKVFLPKWRNRKQAARETALIWDTLARDIKRHEESHLGIAKRYAAKMEKALRKLPARADCEALQNKAEATTARLLKEHDAAQERFDRIEQINFEKRLMKLLHYRLEQIENGRIPG